MVVKSDIEAALKRRAAAEEAIRTLGQSGFDLKNQEKARSVLAQVKTTLAA
jgi:hypothetical protein